MRKFIAAAVAGVLVAAAALGAPAPASADDNIPTLRQYLEWCLANDSDCRADLHRYVKSAVGVTISNGGNPICAYGTEDHWADYMLNWLRQQERRGDEPAPDVFHDAVQAIYTCIG